jgi:ectoine hydroxylase-related dioxygenase (phytanoyl-CoA dioxygenase family)
MATAFVHPSGPAFGRATCRLEDLVRIVETPTSLDDYPHAARVEANVPVYESAALRVASATPDGHAAALDELAAAFLTGPGIVVLAGALDVEVVDRATTAFRAMIAGQHAADAVAGDHFAPAGANDRVWNAMEKLALADPGTFVDYYASDMIALAATAWLGPGYQITSQVNVVNPGGQAQAPHRDYHLGFTTDEVAEQYPPHVHALSPMLTLQGAIAHGDMPVESGPTMYLPHSQKYAEGYLAWRRPEFIDYFAGHHVQLPLRSGDAVFFNPALFHAAGTNRTTDIARMANLLQISSAFGRAMETVDRRTMTLAVYDTLLERIDAGLPAGAVDRVVAAVAEGYAFPTNLDLDQPVDGLTPPSQADVLRAAVRGRWPLERMRTELDAHDRRRSSRPRA